MGPLQRHDDAPYVSTGHLPSPEQVRRSVDDAYERYRTVAEGENSRVYPALTRVPAELFGICAVGTSGSVYAAGDAGHGFAIMSVAKPFVFALVCQALGPEEVRRRVGVNATGMAFDSLAAVERGRGGRTNSRATGASGATRPRRSSCTPGRSSLRVTVTELAVMGATLADGGLNPLTRERVVDAAVCHFTLAVMTTAGMYEASGDWLYDVGVPGKSGIGGGIVVVSPGKGGLGTFAPPLDGFGNSVKGRLAARFLARRLGLSLFVSEPET